MSAASLKFLCCAMIIHLYEGKWLGASDAEWHACFKGLRISNGWIKDKEQSGLPIRFVKHDWLGKSLSLLADLAAVGRYVSDSEVRPLNSYRHLLLLDVAFRIISLSFSRVSRLSLSLSLFK
jgi:hypothetical protein